MSPLVHSNYCSSRFHYEPPAFFQVPHCQFTCGLRSIFLNYSSVHTLIILQPAEYAFARHLKTFKIWLQPVFRPCFPLFLYMDYVSETPRIYQYSNMPYAASFQATASPYNNHCLSSFNIGSFLKAKSKFHILHETLPGIFQWAFSFFPL